MAITDPHSVLILGAGVSAPFDIPLGGELIAQVGSAIKSERSSIYPKEDYGGHQTRRNYMYGATELEGFSKTPIYGAFGRQYLVPGSRELNWAEIDNQEPRLRALAKLLEDQTSETIDDFIVENPGYADLAKISIAALLLKKCYGSVDNHGQKVWQPRRFSARVYNNAGRNWIHLLINIIRHGIRRGAVTPENKVKIITFNYDRILEYVLEQQFSNTELNHPHYTAFVDILHVHGCFDPLETDRLDFAEMALKWAKGIHVVNETSVPEGVERMRGEARSLIAEAKEIYSVGFAFAGPNCKLLGLDSLVGPQRGRRYIRFCNYNGNVGVKRSAENLARSAPTKIVVEEAAGTLERPLGVNDWLASGHLGEMPA